MQQSYRPRRSFILFSTDAATPLLADRCLFLLQAGRRHTLANPARLLGSSGTHT
ncbi:hypothetical protein KIF53_04175 [Chromobacterium subtsugae]|uniref:Uncharacterized protein n=1 Tax=Chromobacterium subtsugae TaxID=251747 RepID=A0ABS7F9Q6_9NEIS|nr:MULTISPECIES: hypothetical protein [Chromobacterium]MBW7565331.1 hypothetical protein [Chromobacterium subtsugae]MBW8286818.1 hypothetical protein [Chromobacterium subtsugae]